MNVKTNGTPKKLNYYTLYPTCPGLPCNTTYITESIAPISLTMIHSISGTKSIWLMYCILNKLTILYIILRSLGMYLILIKYLFKWLLIVV